MPRRVIGDEVAAKALRLYRQGHSYRAIGAALGIDPRTAKHQVQRVAAEEQADHWKAVAQLVDVKYVEEHYQLMLSTSSGVLRALETHPRDSAATRNAEESLTYNVSVALIQSKEILQGRGIGLTPGPEDEVEISEKVSNSLLNGLKEHERQLASALDGPWGWVKQWQDFQAARQELFDQALGLLTQRGCQKDAASSMAESAVGELIQNTNAENVGNRGFHPPPLTDELKGADYFWMLEQISHPEQLLDLNQADTRVVEAATLLGKEVLQLQLRGRPIGECSLCPSRGGT